MKPRLLIIDNDPVIARLIRMRFGEDYEIFGSLSGTQLDTDLERSQPDLILLDAQLPLVDGFTLCRQIRKHPVYAARPVVMVSGSDVYTEVRKAFSAGVNQYLSKPFDLEVLNKTIQHLLAEPGRPQLKAA